MAPAQLILLLILTLPGSTLKSDETVVFFPTFGSLSPDGVQWTLNVHGWTYEPETDSIKRKALLSLFRKFLGLPENQPESKLFETRAHAFLVDNEGGKEVPIRLGNTVYTLGPSQPNGHLRGTITLPADRIGKPPLKPDADGWLQFHATLGKDPLRQVAGSVQLIGPEGISVISDIDDTIKISEVRNRPVLMANTFLRPYRPVPGMPEAFTAWKKHGLVFHYVSAGPWALFDSLAAFFTDAGFPKGSIHLRDFRWRDASVLNLFESPRDYKLQTIETILAAFPKRSFILIGDSGEQDPEIYGELARKHPAQIHRIFIRNVTADPLDAPRFQAAFKSIPQPKWTLFTNPQTLQKF